MDSSRNFRFIRVIILQLVYIQYLFKKSLYSILLINLEEEKNFANVECKKHYPLGSIIYRSKVFLQNEFTEKSVMQDVNQFWCPEGYHISMGQEIWPRIRVSVPEIFNYLPLLFFKKIAGTLLIHKRRRSMQSLTSCD
jgi:hypothetical protein